MLIIDSSHQNIIFSGILILKNCGNEQMELGYLHNVWNYISPLGENSNTYTAHFKTQTG